MRRVTFRSESTGASAQSVICTPQYSLAPSGRRGARPCACGRGRSGTGVPAARGRSTTLRSSTVGTISGNGTFFARSRSSCSDASEPLATFGGCRFGVWSIGAAARLPWKVLPTTTVSIAPLPSDSISRHRASRPWPSRTGSRPSRRRPSRRAAWVVVDLGLEVGEVGRVRRAGSGRDDVVAALAEQAARVRRRARDAVAVQHRHGRVARRRRLDLSFCPSATAVAFSGDSTSGLANC